MTILILTQAPSSLALLPCWLDLACPFWCRCDPPVCPPLVPTLHLDTPPGPWRSHGSPQKPLSSSPCPLGCLWTSHHPEARTSVGDATAFVTYCPTSHGKGTPEVDKGLWGTLCKVSHRTKRIHVFNCLFKLSACWISSIVPAQGGKSGLSQFTWVARTKYWFPCSFGGWTLRSGTSRVGSFQDLLPRLVDSYLFPVPSRHGNHLFSFAPWQPPPSCPFTRDGRLLPVPSYRDGLLFPVPSHHDGHLLPVFSWYISESGFLFIQGWQPLLYWAHVFPDISLEGLSPWKVPFWGSCR